MRKLTMAALALILAAPSGTRAQSISSHPRIWLTSDVLATVAAKRNSGDPDYLQVKALADKALTLTIPRITITGATNSSPVVFTTSTTVPWSGTLSATLYLKGATGSWAGIENSPETRGYSATRTGSNTFTVPIDSSSFGSFSGQSITAFVAGGEDGAFLGYGYQGSGWQDALLSLALLYKVTGTQSYAIKALELLDWINTLGAARMISPVSQDSGRADMATTFCVAIAYDWLYDALSSQQRSATVNTLNVWNDWTVNNAYGRGDPTTNYWEAHVTATASVGYATYGDNSRAQGWIDWATNQWSTYFAPKFFNRPNGVTSGYNDPTGFFYTGGLAVIGWNYGGNDIGRHLKYMEMVRTATGQSVPNGVEYAKSWARALPYQLKPDRVKTPTWGRWTGDWYGMYTKTGPLMLTYFLRGTTEGEWAQWFYTHYGTYPGYSETIENAYDRLLFLDVNRKATDYRPALSPFSFNDGLAATVFWRSSWADTSDYAYFNASTTNAAGELPKSAGHVDVTRGGDYLLVQSNMWKGTGDGTHGSPEMETYNGGLANTLYFFDGGASSGAKCFNQDYNYDGCQTGFGIYKSPKVKLTPNGGFSENEFATAYDYAQAPAARTLQYFFRAFVPLGDGVYVVWDRIRSTSASHTKQIRWQLSSASTPVASGGVVTSTVGGSKIFVDTVLPASARVALVRNASGGSPTNWRAEVTDPAASNTYTGLTVLYATSGTGTLPAVTRLTTVDSGFEAIQIGGDTPKVAVLPKGVVDGGDGTFTSATSTKTTFTTDHSGTATYVVGGLAAGAYSVSRNGSILAGQSSVGVDSSGALVFSAASGAFSINPSGMAPDPTPPAPAPAPAPTPTPTPTPVPGGSVLSGFDCSPLTLSVQGRANCAVTVSSAVTAAVSVVLSANNSQVDVPSSVIISPLANAAYFIVDPSRLSTSANVVISATVGAETRRVTLSITGPTGSSPPPPAPSTGQGTYTCTNDTFSMTADITLRNDDSVVLVGTESRHCTLAGNGHRFIVADKWSGRMKMDYVDVTDVGTASLPILGGIGADQPAILGGSGIIDIQHSTFRRSGGFNIMSYDNVSVVFSRNVYNEDNRVSVDANVFNARPFFKEGGSSTASKFMQGNRVFRSWAELGSPNWTFGAAANCTSTCDADGNIMIGPRVGFSLSGTGSYASYNYSHITLDVTADWPVWSQVANVGRVAQGSVAANNVIRSGHWVAQAIDGELRNNVLLELHPHEFVRIGSGGKIHHNILLSLYPGIDRYTSASRLPNGDAAFGLVQSGNSLSIYNNTLDLRGSAVVSVLVAIDGAMVNSFRNNVAYRLNLTAANCPSGVGCTSAVGGAVDYADPVTTATARAAYMDYNSFYYDPASPRRVTYNIGVTGKSLCQAGFGGHDLGTCPNGSVDPQFRGPLPIATGKTGMPSVDDSGFPFNDGDILSGTYSVSQLLAYFRWIYAPGAGSPLVGAQDPQDGSGNIGAVQAGDVPAAAPTIVATNKRPMVYAGPSFSVGSSTSTVMLSGYAADDGLPSRSLAVRWSVVSGPGTVTFGNSNAAITTAAFSAAGIYTLRLTAEDGALTSNADVQIGIGAAVPSTWRSTSLLAAPLNVRIVH